MLVAHETGRCRRCGSPSVPSERSTRGRRAATVSDRVPITHPEKVLFPADGITKGDLVAYYRTVAPRMLPLVSGRPVTLQRFPDGIGRGGFLQKQVGRHFPDWIERVTAPNRRTRQATVRDEVTYAVCRTADDLAYLANQGCVTPHVWLSRAPDIHHPDQMVFDLDPASEDLGVLRLAAASLRGLLDELGLAPFLKSSGSRGLHVVVPLVPAADTDTVKVFSIAVAEALAARHPGRLHHRGPHRQAERPAVPGHRAQRLRPDHGRSLRRPGAARGARLGPARLVGAGRLRPEPAHPRLHRRPAGRARPVGRPGGGRVPARPGRGPPDQAQLTAGRTRVASSSQAGRRAPAPRRLPQVDRLAATSAGVAGRALVRTSP